MNAPPAFPANLAMPSSFAPPPPGPPPGWVPPPGWAPPPPGPPVFGTPPLGPPGPPPTLAAPFGPADRTLNPYGSPYMAPVAPAPASGYSSTYSWDPRKGPAPPAAALAALAAPASMPHHGHPQSYGGPSPNYPGHSPRPSQPGPSGHHQGARMYIPVRTWASTQSSYRSTTYYDADIQFTGWCEFILAVLSVYWHQEGSIDWHQLLSSTRRT